MEYRRINRLAEVRKNQNITVRSVSRAIGITVNSVKDQERPDSDLRISELLEWQRALKVPVSELLIEPGQELSRPVMERSRMLRLMRTAVEMHAANSLKKARLLSESIVDQILEIMPDLAPMKETNSEGKPFQMPQGDSD